MSTDALSATFAALADPTRRAILARLAKGEASVNELAEPFDMSVRAVSKHLRVLEDAGLVTSNRDAQRRPRQLTAAPLEHAVSWLEQYRLFWEGSLDRMEHYVREVQKERETKPEKPRKPKKENGHGSRN
ncbi:Transcriptional regulator, ArsR family [Labilithrix luteola]|uniref:Transcriptional regulator, ArsR family n=1 Tax=Labilithrix luteola TaxID=1391654 RepID=A0A0K1Q4A7_9BACT|nr:metalloregulator ArsR/SmtB family transcription factor [Labilithrix luteola]AKV00574.1 Transcriptional regulator, ArsR family [Labilithrix luteola]